MAVQSRQPRVLSLPFQAVAVAVVSLDTQASPAFQGFLATTLARAAFPVSAVTLAFLVTVACQAIQALAFLVSQAFLDSLA
jgi:hypothetical protein